MPCVCGGVELQPEAVGLSLKFSGLGWVTRRGVKSEHTRNVVEDVSLEVESLDTRRQGSKLSSSGDE